MRLNEAVMVVEPDRPTSSPFKEKNEGDIPFFQIAYINEFYAYLVQKYIFDNTKQNIISSFPDSASYRTISIDHDKQDKFIARGSISFILNENLYNYHVDLYNSDIHKIIGPKADILVENILEEVKKLNFLKGKLCQIKPNNSLSPTFLPIKKISFEDVILSETLKEDIFDNTIYQLDQLHGSNGIILHGNPGVGKSLTLSAIIYAATKLGYPVLLLTTQVYFSGLKEIIKLLYGPCILIFEDVDATAQSREYKDNPLMSDFLQFVNGVSNSDDPIIIIVTTNFLNKLDEAVANRPVRFNRKFEFKTPTASEIDKLVELYFGKKIMEKFSKRCYNLEFTGAHISELKRTADLLAKKHDSTIEEQFLPALDIIKSHFSNTLSAKTVGFNNN